MVSQMTGLSGVKGVGGAGALYPAHMKASMDSMTSAAGERPPGPLIDMPSFT